MKKIVFQIILSVLPILAFGANDKDTIMYDQFAFELDLVNKTAKTIYIPLWPYDENLVIVSEVPYKGEIYKVTTIGDGAFHAYPHLKTVTIPNSVTYIGKEAFRDCTGLTSVTLSNNLDSIGNCAFQYCSGLLSIEIPNSVTCIGAYAFHRCSSLTSITIPSSVKYIRDTAFAECSTLSSITIPNGVLSIGRGVFSGCSSLTTLVIPSSVTYIGGGITTYDINLKSISVEEGNRYYDSRDNCNAIIETATNKLVSGCMNTFIPNNVVTLGISCLEGITSLTSIEIPNTVTTIENFAFYGCSGLTSINLPNSLTTIHENVIYGCNSLTEITIPKSVTYIGYNAFYCDNLRQVVSLIEKPTDPYDLFSSNTLSFGTLYVPVGTKDEYKKARAWRGFKNIIEGTPAGVNSISLDEQITEATRFTLDGKRQIYPKKGLNIIRYSNGSVKKKIEK